MGLGRLGLLWFAGWVLLLGAGMAHAQQDPPAQVARLARMAGIVTVRDAGEAQWRLARVNLPLPPGISVWVEPGGQAVLDMGASRIGLDGGTEFRLDTLGEQGLEATLASGTAYLRLLHGPAARIRTARGLISPAGDGRYAIGAGVITVLEGTARVEMAGTSMILEANQTAAIGPDGALRPPASPALISTFMVAMMARDPFIAEATPDVARQMTGVGDLARFGEWRSTPEYGAIWIPRVETGWVPYRHGIWAWVEPWGWSWVDDAPWGFAPFHYGRWVEIDGRWAWVPAPLHAGVGFRPAYAPALVGFLGVRGRAMQGPGAVLGWVPLGPGDAYVPPFPASADFIRRLNMNHVRNVVPAGAGAGGQAVVSPGVTPGVTIVPAWTMVSSRPADLARRRLPPLPVESLEALPASGLPGPALTSWGMTPALARRMGLLGDGGRRMRPYLFPTLRPAEPGGTRPQGTAPGPEILPRFPGMRGAPGPRGGL